MIWLLILALFAGSVTNRSYYPEVAGEIAIELAEESRMKIGWLIRNRMWACIIDYSHEEYSGWTTISLLSHTGSVVNRVDLDVEAVSIVYDNLVVFYKKLTGGWYPRLMPMEEL